MPSIDFVVETPVSRSTRARQLESIFDVPPQEKCRIEYKANLPIQDRDWSVGAIIGPSGCGKSTILNRVFGEPVPLQWNGAAVIDDFPAGFSINEVGAVCQSVGFNTIPAWLRPYHVLSNGEKFRADMARRLMEMDTVVIDEFTSVVDRQVAKIGSHAFQKYIRKHGKKAVVAACHYDIEDWLQPDWVFEPGTMQFRWRSLRRRPEIQCEIRRVPYSEWRRFAPFHYMSAELHRAAKCFVLDANGVPASFMAVLHKPISSGKKAGSVYYAISRGVTLPDYQGIGLQHVLRDRVSACFSALGFDIRCYPAHPALIDQIDKSDFWRLEKRPGYGSRTSKTSKTGKMGHRPCAVFSYKGDPHPDRAQAALITGL
jgi:ABC-type lipoprotein export system ATPase subunit